MKTAVYSATRNLYADILPAAKSLLRNSDVERIYFLIEDDVFPYELPECIKTINVSGQKFFPTNGPNYYKKWTYMELLKLALSKIFPELDKVVYLDVDTIVIDDVSDLWDELPYRSHYLAGVKEPQKSKCSLYINAGVLVENLAKLREDRMDDKILFYLNTRNYRFTTQDCLYHVCRGRMKAIDGAYNVTFFTDPPTQKSKIIHFAAIDEWQKHPLVKVFREMPWEAVRR